MTAKYLQSKSAWLTVQGEWGTAAGSLGETGLGSPAGSWSYPPPHPTPPLPSAVMLWGKWRGQMPGVRLKSEVPSELRPHGQQTEWSR